jgi:hypothetical protein
MRRKTKNLLRGLLSYTPWSASGRRLLPREEWSIGLTTGRGVWPLEAQGDRFTRVVTRHDVTDSRSEFVADPFIVREGSLWYLFFETFSVWRGLGEIACARSRDLIEWEYGGIVLSEPFHLSYPNVFRCDNAWYMIPESGMDRSVRLYRATRFPGAWELVATLIRGSRFYDPTVIRHENRWWMFVETAPGKRFDTLRLLHASSILGPWTEHLQSPIINRDATRARPAGRIIPHGGSLYRLSQDCSHTYGRSVSAHRILDLSIHGYDEQLAVPGLLAPGGRGWRASGMHHLDLHVEEDGSWVAVADGLGPPAGIQG